MSAWVVRGLSALLGTTIMLIGIACGTAKADDDDDDDDWTESSSSRSSSVEMWPPAEIGWPPLTPEDSDTSTDLVMVPPIVSPPSPSAIGP